MPAPATVMTFNACGAIATRGPRGESVKWSSTVGTVIVNRRPMMIGLQEVTRAQHAALMKRITWAGYRSKFVPLAASRYGDVGIALLVNTDRPLLNTTVTELPYGKAEISIGEQPRALLCATATVRTMAEPVRWCVTHLGFQQDAVDQAVKVAAQLNKTTLPVVLVGDLNYTTAGYPYQLLTQRAHLVDASDNPTAIDHILSRGIRFAAAVTVPLARSDHRLVTATLRSIT